MIIPLVIFFVLMSTINFKILKVEVYLSPIISLLYNRERTLWYELLSLTKTDAIQSVAAGHVIAFALK